MIGQKLNQRYTITARLGKGAMGTVYRATDSQTEQEVALKIISSELALDPAMLERFKREGKALRQLRHVNIVRYIDAFEHDEHYVIVMEYVAGGSLHDLIKKGHIPIERAKQITLDLCDALIHSHRLKIIHRDIKPENILIDENGTPKLADFGVARLSEGTRMTRTGTKVGTPYYMAPEAWKGETINAQADIWSVGVVMYEMLAGKVPFDGDSEFTVMTKVTTTSPPDLKKLRKDAPASLVEIVIRMLAREKPNRYQTMREVAVDLERGENSKTAKPAKQTRIVIPKTKIDIKRYRNYFIFGIAIIGVLVAVNFLPSLDIPNQPAPQNTQIFIGSPTNTTVSLTNTSIPVSPTSEFGIDSTMVSENDGMTLVFVPAGEFTMGSEDGNSDERPEHQVYLDAFWIDQIEVTNIMYAKCVDTGSCDLPANTIFFCTSCSRESHPVTSVDWDMANAYCSWAGRRLPTEAEWEKAARGTDGRIYPWGNNAPSEGLLNINAGVDYVTSGGRYPNGKSIYGAYDLAGNVSEWVSSLYQPYPYDANDGRENLSSSENRVLRGGSWLFNVSDVRSSLRGKNGPTSTSYDLGFRCALTADVLTTTLIAPTFTLTPEQGEPGIGSTTVSEKDSMALVFVAAGEFMMGSENGESNERPVHTVNLSAFWIDQTEVTNAMYRLCVADGVCDPPDSTRSSTHIDYFGNSEFTKYPVVYVSWNDANSYCSWADRRLPSEAEWEKAASWDASNQIKYVYPWGNDIDCSFGNFFYGSTFCIGDVSDVNDYLTGASPYGALDMAGNVWEWVSSLYKPYPYNAGDDREELIAVGNRVLRGGSWRSSEIGIQSTVRYSSDPTPSNDKLGFRCASSP